MSKFPRRKCDARAIDLTAIDPEATQSFSAMQAQRSAVASGIHGGLQNIGRIPATDSLEWCPTYLSFRSRIQSVWKVPGLSVRWYV